LPHWTTALLLTILCDKLLEEEIIEENLASRLVSDFGLFDPTLDLSITNIQLTLKDYSTGGITIQES
jgi:S-DNA-T family DNA segregation ATPase FtsK/SpoIIIE